MLKWNKCCHSECLPWYDLLSCSQIDRRQQHARCWKEKKNKALVAENENTEHFYLHCFSVQVFLQVMSTRLQIESVFGDGWNDSDLSLRLVLNIWGGGLFYHHVREAPWFLHRYSSKSFKLKAIGSYRQSAITIYKNLIGFGPGPGSGFTPWLFECSYQGSFDVLGSSSICDPSLSINTKRGWPFIYLCT